MNGLNGADLNRNDSERGVGDYQRSVASVPRVVRNGSLDGSLMSKSRCLLAFLFESMIALSLQNLCML